MLLNNRYRLTSELGKGGMGTIYSAHDTLLDRDVAVKLLSGQGLGTEGRARMLREAQAAARLNHPNIVSIYDAGEAAGDSYIVMELIEGESLHQHPPADLEELLSISRQICAALEHAHLHQIVHRDLKPENVLVTPEGIAKLTDFGLARPVASRLTSEGTIIGTVFYISPEQALGREVDARADLYALGVMLYEFTAGQLPFVADEPIAVISQHLYAPVVPPRVRNPQVHPLLDELIVQLLSKTPDDRPASAADVLQRLERVSSEPAQVTVVEEPGLIERINRGRIVGREKEIAEARAIWGKVLTHTGQFLLVSGEPGIGKTRLTREVITLAEVSGGKTLVGECYPEGGAPYTPFAQMLRRALSNGVVRDLNLPPYILADLISISPDLRLRFPDIPPNPRLDPQAEQQRLFENTVAFLAALSQRQPCLMVLEDAHWADQASLNLLRHLARRTRRQRLMILATYREVELDEALPFQDTLFSLNRERLTSRLKLSRLELQDTRRMLTTLLGDQIPEAFVEGIFHETEGNPFFIEEVCKSLVESGKLYFADGHWQHPDLAELQIPQSVRVTIQARLSKLPAEYQEILQLAAIVGRDFDYEILAKASQQDEERMIEALEQAERAQLIEELSSYKGGTFRFAHALIPTTLVEGLIGLRRRKLHRRIAEVIELLRPDDLEALAYQYSQAELPEKAWSYLLQAGQRAQERYANDDAIRYYSDALEFCENDRDRFTTLAARQAVYHLVARRPEQLADLNSMQIIADKLNDDTLRFDTLIALADYYSKTDYPQAQGPSQQALTLAEKMDDPVRQARALYILASVAMFTGDMQRCIEYQKQALDKFQAAGQIREVISCLYLASLAHINLGEQAAGKSAAEKAVRLSRQLNDRRQEATSLRRLGITLESQQKTSEALELFRAALAMHREVGDRAEECNALNALASALVELGRLEEARQYYLEGLELAETINQDMALGMIVSNLVSNYHQSQGDYQGGLELLEQQLQRARNYNEQGLIFTLSRLITELQADVGQYTQALSSAKSALQIAEQRNILRSRIELLAWSGRLQALLGNFVEAHQLLDTSQKLAQASEDPESYSDVYFNAAYVSWLRQDIEEQRAGLELARLVSARWKSIKFYYALGFSIDMEARLLLALGDAEAALERTSEAVQTAESQPGFSGLEQVYYTHASVLRSCGDQTQAAEYLRRAYERVMQVAMRLTDENLRRSWLENVRYNREIIANWENRAPESTLPAPPG